VRDFLRLGIGFNADVAVEQIVSYASSAEEMGFDSLWMHEHSFGRDSVSFLSEAAHRTSKMRLGFACLNPYTRHPVALAMTLRTLQESSRGRAVLGLGTGFPMRLDLLGVKHDKPIAALKETMDICRGVWRGENVSYSGKVFSVKNVKSIAGPSEKRISIYIAGWKKMMLKLTGSHAEGYVAKGGESVQSLKQIVMEIEASANSVGRKIEDVEVCAYLLTLVEKTPEAALDRARRDPWMLYMLSVQDDYLYQGTGIDPDKKKPISENYFKGNVEAASRGVTDEMLESFALVGTTDHIIERISEFEKAGLNLPILQPLSMKPDDVKAVLRTGSSATNTITAMS
jgi:5,10-methylenetetrahydromethanopterin reductase